MPICKYKPNISQLLEVAVKQTRELHNTTYEILERPASIWFKDSFNDDYSDSESDSDSDSDSSSDGNILSRMSSKMLNQSYAFLKYKTSSFIAEPTKKLIQRFLIKTSRLSKKMLENGWFKVYLCLLAIFASFHLAYEVKAPPSLNTHTHSFIYSCKFKRKLFYLIHFLQISERNLQDKSYEHDVLSSLDIVINILLILKSIALLLSIPISIKIENAFNREIDWSVLFFYSGIIDFVISIICLSLTTSVLGLWFRILRTLILARVFLEVFPYIQVLMVLEIIYYHSTHTIHI